MAINFRSNGQGRIGGVVVLLLRECLDCLELNDWDNRVKCLWVSFQGKPTRQISRWVSVIDAPRGRRNILQAAEKSLKITSTSSRGTSAHQSAGNTMGQRGNRFLERVLRQLLDTAGQ